MVWPCACMIIGTRRTMPSRSGLIVNRPRPAAACSSTGTLRNRPGKSNMKRCGSSPSIASPVTGSVLSSGAISSGSPDSPSTTREALMASAKTWSLLGSARSLARVSSSRLRKVSAAKAGLRRSGSENTASNAITTAPSRVSSVTRSAIRVRGHGHCPSFSRLLSSMSTMVTGLAVFLRGSMRWKASKVLTRISSTGAGSAMRNAANPINSARHSSRAYPMRRLNHLGKARNRFMASIVRLTGSVRQARRWHRDHGASAIGEASY